MDTIKKYWLEFLARVLRNRARQVLHRHDPLVVAITGSVGKTSTKEAIYEVLRSKYPTIRNKGNFNNEIGVPLTVLKKSKPVGVLNWMWFVLTSGWHVRKIQDYPAYLVLELAADRHGDIKYLCDMVKPTIGVITNVGEAHMEYFGTQKKIMIEKRALIESIPKTGKAILNFDDDNVMLMAKKSEADVVTYGLKSGAEISAKNISIGKDGTSFKIVYGGGVVPVKLQLVGYSFARSALAAVAVGLSVGMELMEITDALANWKPLPGRMRLIEGRYKTTILDDSYNASKDSMLNAFETIKSMSIKGRKVAVLGSMWELGRETKRSHIEIGKRAAKLFDKLVCIQEHGDIIKEGAIAGGMKQEDIHVFGNTDAALYEIDQIVESGDFVLVKGSQGKNRLEKVVKVLMKNPEKAKDLLVRQSKEWLEK